MVKSHRRWPRGGNLANWPDPFGMAACYGGWLSGVSGFAFTPRNGWFSMIGPLEIGFESGDGQARRCDDGLPASASSMPQLGQGSIRLIRRRVPAVDKYRATCFG